MPTSGEEIVLESGWSGAVVFRTLKLDEYLNSRETIFTGRLAGATDERRQHPRSNQGAPVLSACCWTHLTVA